MSYVLGCHFCHDERPEFVSRRNTYVSELSLAVRFQSYEDAASYRSRNEQVYELDEQTGTVERAVDPNKGKA